MRWQRLFFDHPSIALTDALLALRAQASSQNHLKGGLLRSNPPPATSSRRSRIPQASRNIELHLLARNAKLGKRAYARRHGDEPEFKGYEMRCGDTGGCHSTHKRVECVNLPGREIIHSCSVPLAHRDTGKLMMIVCRKGSSEKLTNGFRKLRLSLNFN